jgi:hypothetical protein
MATVAELELMDLPQVAALVGHSTDAIKALLRKRPGIEGQIARRWGRRLLTPANVAAIRAAFAEREKATAG